MPRKHTTADARVGETAVEPSLSVIVTCHNLERYIGRAIESVLAQDYQGSIELIVVDDASADGSREVIQRYPEVSYINSSANIGVLMATVCGLQNATKDIVFFLDGDDVWRHDKLRLCVERFFADPQLGLLTHDLAYIDASERLLKRVSRPSEEFGSCLDESEWVRGGILNHTDYVWLGSALGIRRSLIDANAFCAWAAQLPDPFNTYQDWPLAYWAASRRGIRMGYVSAKLLNYRLHHKNHSGDASTADKAIRNFRRSLITVCAIADIVKRFDIQGPPKTATLRKLKFRDYLVALYSGDRGGAIKKFIAIQFYLLFVKRSAVREWVRFTGIQLFGVRRFIRLAASFRNR